VYKKAFNAASMSAYRSTYKSAIGKAEQVAGRGQQMRIFHRKLKADSF